MGGGKGRLPGRFLSRVYMRMFLPGRFTRDNLQSQHNCIVLAKRDGVFIMIKIVPLGHFSRNSALPGRDEKRPGKILSI